MRKNIIVSLAVAVTMSSLALTACGGDNETSVSVMNNDIPAETTVETQTEGNTETETTIETETENNAETETETESVTETESNTETETETEETSTVENVKSTKDNTINTGNESSEVTEPNVTDNTSTTETKVDANSGQAVSVPETQQPRPEQPVPEVPQPQPESNVSDFSEWGLQPGDRTEAGDIFIGDFTEESRRFGLSADSEEPVPETQQPQPEQPVPEVPQPQPEVIMPEPEQNVSDFSEWGLQPGDRTEAGDIFIGDFSEESKRFK